MAKFVSGLFQAHPSSIGETYREHAAIALRFGTTMIIGGLACILHSVFPFIFQRSASRRIRSLHRELSDREQNFHRSRAGIADPRFPLEYEI